VRTVIIDLGIGNLRSLYNALKMVDVEPEVVEFPDQLSGADAIVLPGVGSYAAGSSTLRKFGWIDAIRSAVDGGGIPLLGICLGMQLLSTRGYEGTGLPGTAALGLDLVSGEVVNMRSLGCSERVPHVGWNSVDQTEGVKSMFRGIPDGTDFYFVHSYVVVVDDSTTLSATVDHGVQIPAAIARDNIWGVQFHPEKSSWAGLQLLQNFVTMASC
jgi:glutamine amidotransferase